MTAIEVHAYYCRFCGKQVEQRARHEPRCKKNPMNIAKKQRREKERREDEKHPTSVNMLEKHIRFINKLTCDGLFDSQSSFIRDCIEYVLKHPDMIEAIQHEKKENSKQQS
jgi:hypothetical protein